MPAMPVGLVVRHVKIGGEHAAGGAVVLDGEPANDSLPAVLSVDRDDDPHDRLRRRLAGDPGLPFTGRLGLVATEVSLVAFCKLGEQGAEP